MLQKSFLFFLYPCLCKGTKNIKGAADLGLKPNLFEYHLVEPITTFLNTIQEKRGDKMKNEQIQTRFSILLIATYY